MLSKNHIMLDLETLGNNSNSPIISFGAVALVKGVEHKFYVEIDMESLQKKPLEVDYSTIAWWMQQSDEARELFKNDGNKVSLTRALLNFQKWTFELCGEDNKGNIDALLWGNGVGFDNVILRNNFKACSIYCRFAFWNDRCYRTLKNMHPDITVERVGVYHNALDDARTQMNHLKQILEKYDEDN